MRGRVTAVLLSLLLLHTAALFSQCDYHLEYSAQYRASMLGLAVDGNDLWTATGYGVALLDRSVDPPRVIASMPLAGVTRVMRVSNGVAFAGGTAGITMLRHGGAGIEILKSAAIGPVNDLAATPNVLFAATPTGITLFDVNGLTPLTAAFPTSGVNVFSLALSGSTLYAADGDSSLEVFSVVVPQSPQKVGTVSTLPGAVAVNAGASRIYVSDGQNTDVFTGTGAALTKLATFPYGSVTLAESSPSLLFAAGNDRMLRALDASVPASPVALFESELVPNGGSINRIGGIAVAGGRLYVGGGDMGLTTYDVSRFTPPYPLLGYPLGAPTSIVDAPNAVYFGDPSGGIREFQRTSSGTLIAGRRWGTGTFTVHDQANGFLLASSGSTLTMWALSGQIPTLQSTVSFSAPVSSAGLLGMKAVVLLSNGSLWTADVSLPSPTPGAAAGAPHPSSHLAVSGGAVAATELRSDGASTIVHYWRDGNVDAAASDGVVEGVATAVAVGGSTAAVFTFAGITRIDFSSAVPSNAVLPQSNGAIYSALAISNGKLLAIDDSSLRMWDLQRAALEKVFPLSGSPQFLDAEDSTRTAAVGTGSGIVYVNYSAESTLPTALFTSGNSYYRRAAASTSRLYLFDGRDVDVFETAGTPSPQFLSSFSAPRTLELGAGDAALYTMGTDGVVSAFSPAGVLIRSANLGEAADATPLAIYVVRGAPWVSISRGCTTATGCEKKTIVLDPQTLVRSATLNGGVIDLVTDGTRAYAIFDMPAEIRVYDTSDALHPNALTTRANDAGAVTIGYSGGNVYALKDKLYVYSESGLTATGEKLAAKVPASNARLLIDGRCAIITGRGTSAETYDASQWSAGPLLPVPGASRTIALSGGRLLVIGDYSVDVWSRTISPPVKRRRATR